MRNTELRKGQANSDCVRKFILRRIRSRVIRFPVTRRARRPRVLFAKHCQEVNANFLRKHFVRSLSFLVGCFALVLTNYSRVSKLGANFVQFGDCNLLEGWLPDLIGVILSLFSRIVIHANGVCRYVRRGTGKFV